MSYILDALKKSEQERMRGVAPNLHAVHTESFQQTRLIPWQYVLISTVMAASAVAMWQHPGQTEKNSARDADLPRLTFAAAPQLQRPAPQTMADAVISLPAVEARQETPAPVPPEPVQQRGKSHAAEPVPIKEKLSSPLPPVATTPPPQDATPPKPQVEPVARASSRQEIIDISELPASVQRSLPKLAISGYVTSPDDPSEKMVGIGSQLVGEGDEVTPGLKLEKIAETAAVFAYKGYRFRVSMP